MISLNSLSLENPCSTAAQEAHVGALPVDATPGFLNTLLADVSVPQLTSSYEAARFAKFIATRDSADSIAKDILERDKQRDLSEALGVYKNL
jgi:hypothetical protein